MVKFPLRCWMISNVAMHHVLPKLGRLRFEFPGVSDAQDPGSMDQCIQQHGTEIRGMQSLEMPAEDVGSPWFYPSNVATCRTFFYWSQAVSWPFVHQILPRRKRWTTFVPWCFQLNSLNSWHVWITVDVVSSFQCFLWKFLGWSFSFCFSIHFSELLPFSQGLHWLH